MDFNSLFSTSKIGDYYVRILLRKLDKLWALLWALFMENSPQYAWYVLDKLETVVTFVFLSKSLLGQSLQNSKSLIHSTIIVKIWIKDFAANFNLKLRTLLFWNSSYIFKNNINKTTFPSKKTVKISSRIASSILEPFVVIISSLFSL